MDWILRTNDNLKNKKYHNCLEFLDEHCTSFFTKDFITRVQEAKNAMCGDLPKGDVCFADPVICAQDFGTHFAYHTYKTENNTAYIIEMNSYHEILPNSSCSTDGHFPACHTLKMKKEDGKWKLDDTECISLELKLPPFLPFLVSINLRRHVGKFLSIQPPGFFKDFFNYLIAFSL